MCTTTYDQYKICYTRLVSGGKLASLAARCNRGMTALMYACKDGHKDVVQLLLELEHSALNVELNARSNDGSTAFMWACAKGRKDVVQLLLVHSSKIELYAQDVSGRTALMDACNNGHKDIVQLLLNH